MPNLYAGMNEFNKGNPSMHKAINELIPILNTQDQLEIPIKEKYGYHVSEDTGYNLYWDATTGEGLNITIWKDNSPDVTSWKDFEYDTLTEKNHYANDVEFGDKDDGFETDDGMMIPKYPEIAYMGDFRGYSDFLGISDEDTTINQFDKQFKEDDKIQELKNKRRNKNKNKNFKSDNDFPGFRR